VWDASVAVHLDAAADGQRLRLAQRDEDAGKWVDPEPDVPALDGQSPPQEHRPAPSAPLASAAELCRRGAARFAARSCAARESAEPRLPEALLDAMRLAGRANSMPQSSAMQVRVA
jgi:hypothetical protein